MYNTLALCRGWLYLSGEEGAARVDQVDAGEAVLEGDFLGVFFGGGGGGGG